MRKEVIERRLAAGGDADSGAGLPRPEASDRSEIVESRRFKKSRRVCYSNTASLTIVRDVAGVRWVEKKKFILRNAG